MRISDWSSDVCSSDLLLLENVYVPAGGDIPDRTLNPKFGQKLDFVERMLRWSESLGIPTVMVGDFNIAPLECDVWSHKQLLSVVSHTPVECEALARLQESHGWIDVARTHVPRSEEHTSELQSLMRISYAVFCLKK